jgi:uncharacterized membrane protein YoaK (UPF0700 family)
MIGYRKRFWVLAAALAALAGYVDALGFLRLGGYFVSFMSGNSTRLAVGLAMDRAAAAVAGRLVAAFVAGVVAGALVAARAGHRRKPAVLVLVAAILAVAALLDRFGIWPAVALAAAMGAVNNAFMRNGEVAVGATYMTGTLVKLGQHLAHALSGGALWGWVPYLLLWSSLTGGAVIGALLDGPLGPGAIVLAVGAAVSLALYAAAIGAAEP